MMAAMMTAGVAPTSPTLFVGRAVMVVLDVDEMLRDGWNAVREEQGANIVLVHAAPRCQEVAGLDTGAWQQQAQLKSWSRDVPQPDIQCWLGVHVRRVPVDNQLVRRAWRSAGMVDFSLLEKHTAPFVHILQV
jgi:hypothetical protein